MNRIPVILPSVLWLAFTTARVSAETLFEVVETDQTITVSELGEPVFTYQRTATTKNGKHSRSHYLHPVWSLDNRVLTEDFPRDHLHHRGIFWAWHQVRVAGKAMGDPWECRDFIWEVVSTRIDQSGSDRLVLATHVLWKSPNYTDDSGSMLPIVDEHTVITVHRADDVSRRIDFEILLQAVAPDVTLGGSNDEKGYGGFSVRMRMPDDLIFQSATGPLQPRTLGIDAGSWVDMSATFGKPAGITMIQHASNPGFPHPWILRQKGSMQNPAYPGRHPVRLSNDQPTRLAYSVLIHRGIDPPLDNVRRILE